MAEARELLRRTPIFEVVKVFASLSFPGSPASFLCLHFFAKIPQSVFAEP